MRTSAQVTKDFLYRGKVVMVGNIIRDRKDVIEELKRAGLVSTELKMELVHYTPGRELPEITRIDLPKINIGVPAWGEYYVDLACKYTIPSILASLAHSDFRDVNFIIHTDRKAPFLDLLSDYRVSVQFMNLIQMHAIPKQSAKLPDLYWKAFKQAHKDILSATKMGQIAVLLNSDVVVSCETFKYVEDQFIAGKRVVASTGIRTEIQKDIPPIGATAEQLFKWIWRTPHHITKECIWGSGESQHPTILFFPDGIGNVAFHCFHLTPMFIRKDREPTFSGTIDDDLMGRYLSEEIAYPHAGECAFAELSPNWKTHPHGIKLSVEQVMDFWGRRMMRPHYLRNFSQRLDVIGHTKMNHPAAQEIVDKLYSVWSKNAGDV
jgi:hypothetical protein